MGFGAYSHEAHLAMTQARRSTAGAELFTQRTCHPSMASYGLTHRESRDSEDHPRSLGVVFALDVSASMGDIPMRLATHTLPTFMQALLDAGVGDAQVLFMGVGYAGGDRAPLQVGQFESTERLMDQWLTTLWLEGGGAGGNESYELAMYFCARHVVMDCVEQRQHRGYLFLTGDELPNPVVSRQQVRRVLGDDLPADVAIRDIIDEVGRSFEVFYLIPEPEQARHVERDWRDLLGDRVVVAQDPDDIGLVAAGLVSLMEGASPTLADVVERMVSAGVEPRQAHGVARSLTPFAASLGRDGVPPLRGVPKLASPGGSTHTRPGGR